MIADCQQQNIVMCGVPQEVFLDIVSSFCTPLTSYLSLKVKASTHTRVDDTHTVRSVVYNITNMLHCTHSCVNDTITMTHQNVFYNITTMSHCTHSCVNDTLTVIQQKCCLQHYYHVSLYSLMCQWHTNCDSPKCCLQHYYHVSLYSLMCQWHTNCNSTEVLSTTLLPCLTVLTDVSMTH